MAQDAHILSVSIGGGNVYSGNITGTVVSTIAMSLRLCADSLRWRQITDIKARAPSDSMVSGIGFWKQKRFGSGGAKRVELISLDFSAPGIREWVGHTWGKWRGSLKEASITDGLEW